MRTTRLHSTGGSQKPWVHKGAYGHKPLPVFFKGQKVRKVGGSDILTVAKQDTYGLYVEGNDSPFNPGGFEAV